MNSIPEFLIMFHGNQTAVANALSIDRNTVKKYAKDNKCNFHVILNGKLMTAKSPDESIDVRQIKDRKLLADLELDYERAQSTVTHLEEQIREVKNRLQGVTKRDIQR